MLFRSVKIKVFFCCLGLGFGLLFPKSYAQKKKDKDTQQEDWWARVVVGGGLSGSLSSGSRIVDVLPMVGYVFHKRFAIGIEPRYSYHRSRHLTVNSRDTSNGIDQDVDESHHHSYGVQVFSQAWWRIAMVQVEYGQINYSYRMSRKNREWVSTLAVGGGIYLPFFSERRGGIFVIGLYDFLQKEGISPYMNRFNGRIGILIGLKKED